MMMHPVKLQRIKNSFSLLRESIAIVKGLKGVLEAPQRKTVDQAPEKAAADADPSGHGAVTRSSHTDD
jgi:hypothetical protein